MRDIGAPAKVKPPRPIHVAALRRADAIHKQQRQRELKIAAAKERRAQNGVRTGRSFTGGRSLPAEKLPPLGGNMVARRQDLQLLEKRKKQIAGPGHGFSHILRNLDTLGQYTVGLGMVKPSRAPGNILESVGVHTRLPYDQAPGLRRPLTATERRTGHVPLSAATPSLGMVPFVPGRLVGRLLGRAPREAVPAAETAIKETTAIKPRTRTVTRPRTPEEAKARLAELDKQHEKIVGTIADRMKQEMGGKFDPGETGRRNLAKGALKGGSGKRAQSRAKLQAEGGKILTQNEELRAAAEARLHQVLAKNPAQAKRFAALEHERQVLRDALNEHAITGVHPGAGFGTISETKQIPPAVVGREPLGPFTREQARTAAGKQVAGSLMSARRAAAEQKKVYSAARAERFGKAQEAGAQAGGGVAGFHAEKAQLKGALPRVKFEKLKNGTLNQHDLEGLFHDIVNHPDLKYGETLTARTALTKAFQEGHALAPHEIAILSKAFGEDVAKVLAHKSFARKVGENAVGILNLPRAVKSSLDVSFPGRQGLGVLAADPKIWLKGFPRQFRGLVSEKSYQEMLDHMHQDPAFALSQEAGVKYTELGQGAAQREEPFVTNILVNRPVKYNPIRASARAYTLYGDYVRLELFKKYLAKAERQGVNIENKNELRDIAKVVNTLSGRGGGKRMQQVAPVANTLLFSPQLIASRVNMLNPLWYSRHVPVGPTSKFATRQAKIAGARLGVGAAGLLGGAAYAGAKVQTDPRSSDFAKIRAGNTRIDVLGGLQQYPRAIAQIASGKAISSTTGRPITLGPGIGNLSRWDVAERFGISKLSPPASVVHDLLAGKTYTGQPLSLKSEAGSLGAPLSIQDALDLYHQTHSIPKALGGYALTATGVGVQTYGPRDTAKVVKQRNDKLRVELTQSIRQQLGRGLTPQVTRALKLRQKRELWFDKVLPPAPGSGASDKEKKTYALHRFNAQIDLLINTGIAPDRAKARRAKAWAKGQDYHRVNSETSRIGRKYFGGAALADVTKKIREHGGHFYLGDY